MRSLETVVFLAAAAFALACIALVSFPHYVLTVESPAARMKLAEGH